MLLNEFSSKYHPINHDSLLEISTIIGGNNSQISRKKFICILFAQYCIYPRSSWESSSSIPLQACSFFNSLEIQGRFSDLDINSVFGARKPPLL